MGKQLRDRIDPAMQNGEPLPRQLRGQADVKLRFEWLGDLLAEEPSQAAVPRIDAAEQFTRVPADRPAMIGLSRPRSPQRLLRRQRGGLRRGIQVGEGADGQSVERA
jgi:hypothetical protein